MHESHCICQVKYLENCQRRIPVEDFMNASLHLSGGEEIYVCVTASNCVQIGSRRVSLELYHS